MAIEKPKHSPKIEAEKLRNRAHLLQQKYKKNLDFYWNALDTRHDNHKELSKLEEENDKLYREIESIYDDLNYNYSDD